MSVVPPAVLAGRGPRRLWLVVAGIALVGTACGGTAVAPRAAGPGSPSPSAPVATPSPVAPTPVPTPVAWPAPVLVQVENAASARPQSGLGEANVVYEYETEGGISRFTAFYGTPPTVSVGPVRSSRLVTIQLLRTYGGVLVYSGASRYVQQLLDNSGLPHVDETTASGDLFRIGSRPAPHNLYTDGGRMADILRRTHPRPVTWTWWGRTDPSALPPGGVPAASVTVPVSFAERPVFTWRPDLGGYTRTEPDTGLAIDAATGSPLHPSTIVVLQVPVRIAPEVEDVSGAHGLDITLQGSGPAQVFVGGQAFTATWNQGSSGPPSLTLASGQPAPIAPGQVWICLVRQGMAAAAR